MHRLIIIHNTFGDDMKVVASLELNCDNKDTCLNKAYALSNTIHDPWYENTQNNLKLSRSANEKGGARSTSINDIICIKNEDDSESFHVVVTAGFEKITPKSTILMDDRTGKTISGAEFLETYEGIDIQTYSHAYTLPFTVDNSTNPKGYHNAKELRKAIQNKLDTTSDDELVEAVAAPFDSYLKDGG